MLVLEKHNVGFLLLDVVLLGHVLSLDLLVFVDDALAFQLELFDLMDELFVFIAQLLELML